MLFCWVAHGKISFIAKKLAIAIQFPEAPLYLIFKDKLYVKNDP